MAGMGPPPKPEGQRRRQNATVAMTKLPAEGRKGRPPKWPLPRDVRMQAKLDGLQTQIDGLQLEAQAPGREGQAARRRLLNLQERAEALSAQIEASESAELELWRELWATPQAVAWEKLRWTRDVALYARLKVQAEYGDLDAAKESRQMGDRLGLTPLAMLRLRWEIVEDQVGQQRQRNTTTARKSAAAGASARKQGLRAVDGGA